jgi:hypothetical protein
MIRAITPRRRCTLQHVSGRHSRSISIMPDVRVAFRRRVGRHLVWCARAAASSETHMRTSALGQRSDVKRRGNVAPPVLPICRRLTDRCADIRREHGSHPQTWCDGALTVASATSFSAGLLSQRLEQSCTIECCFFPNRCGMPVAQAPVLSEAGSGAPLLLPRRSMGSPSSGKR